MLGHMQCVCVCVCVSITVFMAQRNVEISYVLSALHNILVMLAIQWFSIHRAITLAMHVAMHEPAVSSVHIIMTGIIQNDIMSA